MGILDDVVINAKSAAKAVGDGANKVMNISKLRIQIAELNNELSTRYELLGEYVCANCREAFAENAEVVGKIAEIDELTAQMAAVTKELNDKQNKAVCPSCGKHSPSNAQFCSNCGTKLGE